MCLGPIPCVREGKGGEARREGKKLGEWELYAAGAVPCKVRRRAATCTALLSAKLEIKIGYFRY